jgi:hypothetical protein
LIVDHNGIAQALPFSGGAFFVFSRLLRMSSCLDKPEFGDYLQSVF